MYTYSDEWPDESKNLVGLNSTTSDACGDFSTSANVELITPSGYSQSAWDSGEVAQAIALAPLGETEVGQGTISGENGVSYDCGVTATASFILDFDAEIANDLLKMTPGTENSCFTALGTTYCNYDTSLWCTPESSPPDYQPTGVTNVPKATPNPAYYWLVGGLCERSPARVGVPWKCVFGSLYLNGGFGESNNYPKFSCTKNP